MHIRIVSGKDNDFATKNQINRPPPPQPVKKALYLQKTQHVLPGNSRNSRNNRAETRKREQTTLSGLTLFPSFPLFPPLFLLSPFFHLISHSLTSLLLPLSFHTLFLPSPSHHPLQFVHPLKKCAARRFAPAPGFSPASSPLKPKNQWPTNRSGAPRGMITAQDACIW